MGIDPYRIELHPAVVREDIPRLDTRSRVQVRNAIRAKLATNPELYGAPLRETLKGLRKLRVADYRVIYRIEKRIVQIIIIEHRSVVYRDVSKRI